MRIQHNIMSMNAYRNYNNNTSSLSKNLEKLSSGYKINRAGDDAAGLAISEKMRAQITGLTQAQANAKSGINLVQTAEGAMQEVQDMLNRMVKLADQSANGTYDNETDRANLQKEVVQLKSEIDRIADSANFNGIALLDGSMDVGADAKAFDVSGIGGVWGGVGPAVTAATKGKFESGSFVAATETGTADINITYTDKNGEVKVHTIKNVSFGANKGAETVLEALKADETLSSMFNITGGANATDKIIFEAKEAGKSADETKDKGGVPIVTNIVTSGHKDATGKPKDVKFKFNGAGTKTAGDPAKINLGGTPKKGDFVVIDGLTYKYDAKADGSDGKTFKDYATLKEAAKKHGILLGSKAGSATAEKKGQALTLQIGDTSDDFNKLTLSIKDIHVDALGIQDVDIGNRDDANAAVDKIKKAINTVSSIRGDLGATQNRLDHTINNLSVMAENIQDAESTIRDTDVAEEMMSYTKNNILVQSAQAMLAQANQVPQGVLQLLQ